MNFTIEHISNFLQGYLIQEQFVWNIPNYILFALGIMNELQNIAYINAPQFNKFHKLSSEIYLIKIISRPNTLINNNKILSYFAFCHLNCFLIFSFLFTYLMRNRRNNVVTQLGQLFQNSYMMKFLMIYLNISINIIKLGYGYLVFEISIYQIQEKINDSLLLAINSYNLILAFILIPIIQGFFSYNWALDFHKQHMTINETNLTEIRILIRFIQIFISLIYQDDQFFEYIQIILPILSSTIHIYQMQVQKIYIYGFYYQIILFINIMENVQSSQYLCMLLFQIVNQRLLWILISILPFYFINNQTKQFIEKDFLNCSETNIECKNLVFYQMIYNSIINKKNNDVLNHLLYIFCHKKQCQKLKCQCHQIIMENTQQLTLDLYIQDLLLLYKTQLNCMSFKCSKDQIIFSYLQLLFFKKKYLALYKYFEIIFKNTSLYKQQKNEQQYKIKSLEVHQNAFQITNFYKLSILRVAQCLIQMDIQNEFFKQQTSLCKEAQKYHHEITDYINFENQKKSFQVTFQNIIRLKIDYFNSQINQKIEHNLLYELIDSLIKCKKLIKSSNKYFSIQEKQNMLIFYNMELLNDLITAFNYALEKDKNQNGKIKLIDNQFSNHLSYLLIQIKDQNDIQIIQQQLKDINNCIYEKQISFQQLIPDFFSSTHTILIDRFISGQSNKFFQQFNESHIQTEIGLIKKVELIMDINQVNLVNVEIIIFFQEKIDNKFDIIVDQSNKILCFDELILQKFCCDFQFAKMFIGQNIFSLIIQNQDFNLNQNFTSQQIKLQFLDQSKIPQQTTMEIQNSQQAKRMLNNNSYFSHFQAEVEIIKKDVYDIQQYQIFRFKNINKILKQDDIISASEHNQVTQINGSSQINESIFIKNPYSYSDDEVNEEFCDNIYQNSIVQFKDKKLRDNSKHCQKYSQKDAKSKKVQSILEAINSEKNLQILNKQTERASTQQSLQKLEFYKQFRIVHELLNSKKKPKSLHSMILIILLIIIISLIGFSFYLYEIDIFHKYNKDFKLLKIKNDIFYPILSFQVIRFCIVNYNIQLALKMISPQEYQELIKFPQSKIIGSYELLKNGITLILEQNEIFEIFDDEEFTLSFLQKNDQGIDKKQGLRGTLVTLLNYQYEIQDSYIKYGTPDTKSAYFYFQYKNFPRMFNKFQNINDKILNQCIKNAYLAKNSIDLIAYTFLTTITILEIGLILFSIQVQIQQQKLKKLLNFYDPKFIQYELQRLEMLLEQIDQTSNFPFYYQLNLNEKENYFKSVKEQNKVILNVQKQSNQKKKQFQLLHILIKIIHYLICFLIFFIFHIAVEQVHKNIQNTIYLYQNIINLNINTLVIFLTRDVIYYKSVFTFLDEDDINLYYQLNKDALYVINDYVEKILAIKVDDYFIDQSFFNVLKQFSEQNLCVEINQIADNNFTICSQTLNGMLQKGFSPTIISLKNSITTEFDLTNFTNRTQYPILELEGVYLLCYSLQYLLDNYSKYFFRQNQDIEVQYTIIMVISIILSVLYGLFLLKYVNVIEWKNFELLMKFFYVIPQSAIILDDSFLRNTRIFIKNDNLI